MVENVHHAGFHTAQLDQRGEPTGASKLCPFG